MVAKRKFRTKDISFEKLKKEYKLTLSTTLTLKIVTITFPTVFLHLMV